MFKLISALALTFAVACGSQSASPAPSPAEGSASVHKMGGGLNLGKQTGTITLTTGNNNDLAVPQGNVSPILRLAANASGSTLTGINASYFGDGDFFIIRNDGATGLLTITDSDSNSLAADQFKLVGAASIQLAPRGGALVEYDTGIGAFVVMEAKSAVSGVDLNLAGTAHERATGTAPVATSCGTGPVVNGSDVGGTFTTGSAATTCTLTFAKAYVTNAGCWVLPQGTATMPVYSNSLTALTVTTDIASTTYSYGCIGR